MNTKASIGVPSEPVQSNHHKLISLRPALTLPLLVHLRVPTAPFDSGFLTKILVLFLIAPVHSTC
jgi:hypothetical protein